MSQVIVIAAPAALLVPLDEAKAHLRVDHDEENDKITSYLWAAQNPLDGPDGWLGRALARQTLELRLSCFPACRDIALPCPPLFVDETNPLTVKYIDADGVEQTVASDNSIYSIVTTGLAGIARIALVFGAEWPSPRWQADAVRIRYTCGYLPTEKRAEMIKAAIKLYVGMLYDGDDEATIGPTVQRLLSTYRI